MKILLIIFLALFVLIGVFSGLVIYNFIKNRNITLKFFGFTQNKKGN